MENEPFKPAPAYKLGDVVIHPQMGAMHCTGVARAIAELRRQADVSGPDHPFVNEDVGDAGRVLVDGPIDLRALVAAIMQPEPYGSEDEPMTLGVNPYF